MNPKNKGVDIVGWYEKNINRILYSSIFVFIIAITPLIIISFYNHQSLDDYFNAIQIRDTWLNTGSIWKVLLQAAKATIEIYHSWQGTFSGLFFASFQPFVFGDSLYSIVGIVLISVFVISNMVFYRVILIDLLQIEFRRYFIIVITSLLLSIELVISPVQSFYWMNGSVIYTFIYSIMLLLISFVLLAMKEKRKVLKTAFMLISAVLGLVCGGGNFIVGLISVLILFFIVMASLYLKRKDWYIALIIGLLTLSGLVLSVIAPGNAVRLATMPKLEIDPFLAIIKSFYYAFLFYIWKIENITLIIITIPVIVTGIKKVNFNFPLPGVVSIISFCILAAMFTPTLYTMDSSGPARILNIIFFAMIVLTYLNLIYWAGSFIKKPKMRKIIFTKSFRKKVLIICSMLFLLTSAGKILIDRNSFSSVSAALSLVSGEAQTYLAENQMRDTLYKNNAIKRVEVNAFSSPPYVLFFEDITADADHWRNKLISEYYNKEYVKLKQN